MKNFLKVLENSALFKGFSQNEINDSLKCLNAKRHAYAKGDTVIPAGKKASGLGIVLSGCVFLERDDFWGTRDIIARFTNAQCFGYAFLNASSIIIEDVAVICRENAEILFIDANKILNCCDPTCPRHVKMLLNMLAELSEKNAVLNEKIAHITQHSTRAKLISYLSAESKRHKSSDFEIPFTREQLADYLSVERSGLCLELGKMRNEGLLEFKRNKFRLKSPQN